MAFTKEQKRTWRQQPEIKKRNAAYMQRMMVVIEHEDYIVDALLFFPEPKGVRVAGIDNQPATIRLKVKCLHRHAPFTSRISGN